MRIEATGNDIFGAVSRSSAAPAEGFEELLLEFVADVNQDLRAASKAQQALLEGRAENVIELMSTIEKADISLRMATEIRNKAIEAYQEIMRMQV